MALTNEQFELLKQSLQAQKASSSPEVAPKQKTTLGQKVLNAGTSVANFVGAKGISEQFGADIARAKAPQDQKSLVEYPKMKNVVGSALQTGANLLPGAGKGASLAVKTAVGAGTGYAFDVGTKMQDNSQKRSVGQTLTPGIGTAIGATVPLAGNALGKVGSKVKANLQEKSTNKVLDAITPKTSEMKPKEFERFLRQGKIAPSTAKSPAKYILSDQEKAVAMKNRHLISKDPVKTSQKLIEEIARKDDEVGQFLKKNNGIFNSGELRNHVLERMKDIDDVSIPEERIVKLKETIADGFIRALKKNDMESLWQGRKAFDQSIEKVFSGSPTLQNKVKREFRNAIQDYIMERTPDGVYKGKMNDMRELFGLLDNVSTKAVKKKGISKIGGFIKDNATLLKVIGAIGVPVGAIQVLND